MGKISSSLYWPLGGIIKETVFGVGGKPKRNNILLSMNTKPLEKKVNKRISAEFKSAKERRLL
jgi:hypothetical protein